MRRAISTLAISALALAGITACEPPPPPASFTVNVAPGMTGDDADPGDGVCETAPGNGQCTLDAAVQEGNALGRATIHVPPAPDHLQHQLLTRGTITGHLTFTTGDLIVEDFAVRAGDLRIAPGGSLTLERSDLLVTRTAVIEGALLVNGSFLVGGIEVSEGGLLTMLNSYGGLWASDLPVPDSGAWLTNRGTVVVHFSHLQRGAVSSAPYALVHTHAGAVTRLGAVDVVRHSEAESPDCTGQTPESEGYNTMLGCGLDGPGDEDYLDSTGATADIPAGYLGCGTTVTVDFNGNPRPDPEAWHPGQCTRGAWD